VNLLLEYGADPNEVERNATPLTFACIHDRDDIASLLLSKGANPNPKDVALPISVSCLYGSFDCVELLIAKGANVNSMSRYSDTALMSACQGGFSQLVEKLVRIGADLEIVNPNGAAAIHFACKRADSNILQILLNASKNPKDYVNRKTSGGATPMIFVAEKGSVDCGKILSRYGADLDARDGEGKSPLFLACNAGHSDFVAWLLGESTRKNQKIDVEQRLPLLIAAEDNRISMAMHLMEYGAKADSTREDGLAPLFIASQNGHAEMAKLLIKFGANPNRKYKGWSPITIAIRNQKEEVAKVLLTSGPSIDVSTPDPTGYIPMMYAAKYNQLNVAKLLLDHDADKNWKEYSLPNGLNSLLLACNCKSQEVANLLLEKGSNPNHKMKKDESNPEGELTPLLLAVQNSMDTTIDTLLKHGADVNMSGTSGATPILIACEMNRFEIVEKLVQMGADVNARHVDGSNALYAACCIGNMEMVDLLIQKGAEINYVRKKDSSTPLYAACVNKKESVARKLLQSGADMNLGRSPLVGACYAGDVNIVKMLLDAGGDPNHYCNILSMDCITACFEKENSNNAQIFQLLRDKGLKFGENSFATACRYANLETVRNMVDMGVNVKGHWKDMNAIFACVSTGNNSILEYLLNLGISANDLTKGLTPLMITCNLKNLEASEILLKGGADPNILGKEATALYYAAASGSIELVKLLLKEGADPNLSRDGNTPISVACGGGHLEIVIELLNAGADPGIPRSDGVTPLLLACEYDKVKIKENFEKAHYILKENVVDILLQYSEKVKKLDLDAHAVDGTTPLFASVSKNNEYLVKRLLECGASASKACGGISPLQLALHYNYANVANLLAQADYTTSNMFFLPSQNYY
jgi:ankyrin repeat protein